MSKQAYGSIFHKVIHEWLISIFYTERVVASDCLPCKLIDVLGLILWSYWFVYVRCMIHEMLWYLESSFLPLILVPGDSSSIWERVVLWFFSFVFVNSFGNVWHCPRTYNELSVGNLLHLILYYFKVV